MDNNQKAMEKHYKWGGKIDYAAKVPVNTREDLSLAYTPGVAAPCLEIQKHPEKSYELTGRSNLVAVITDGSAVLGLGDIGPEASMPVMEGKCVLFKTFGGVDAVPLCVRTKDVDVFVQTVSMLLGNFGGINLEDISAPRCFEIERRLKEISDIPIFHDDQHGTAVVVQAAVLNALKVVNKAIDEVRIVVCGAGAAGTAITRLLLSEGIKDIIMCNSGGIIYKGREGMSGVLSEMAEVTNKSGMKGSLSDAMVGADVFIGVSAGNIVSREMVISMAEDPIILALANPTPEIMPEDAEAAGAAVVCTGRSDYKNQVNNVIAFPGIFRGALDVRASDINEAMNKAAAYALAGLVSGKQLSASSILPEVFDERILPTVAAAVSEAARKSGLARI